MKEENRVKTWVKNHKKEIIIGVVVVAVIAGGAIIYIKSKNGNKIIAKVNSNKPKNDMLKAPSTDNNIKAEQVSKTPVVKDVAIKEDIMEDVCIQKPIRLTKNNRKKLLELNEGFTLPTHYKDRNSETTRVYEIKNGNLYVQKSGKTCWSDSRYSNKPYIADEEDTHRFLYRYQHLMNTNI